MWAVFVAGSPATLVSQWRVDSASSTALMVAFHQEWNADGGGISKARALQAASVAGAADARILPSVLLGGIHPRG